MSRTICEARCEARRHVIARLVVNDEAHRILEIPRLAVRDVRNGRVGLSVKFGGTSVDLDTDDGTRWTPHRAGCACGSDFRIFPEEMVRIATSGAESGSARGAVFVLRPLVDGLRDTRRAK